VYLVRPRLGRQKPGIALLSACPDDGKNLLHLFEGICRNPHFRKRRVHDRATPEPAAVASLYPAPRAASCARALYAT